MFNKRMARVILVLLFAVISSFWAGAVDVKKIEIRLFEDFQQGEFKGTSLDSKGRLFLGPQIKPIASPPCEYYLSLDTAANGDIFIGTGHKASVYRIKASPAPQSEGNTANAEPIFTADEELDVYAVAVNTNGDVYAATSPDGKIYKIAKNSKDKTPTEFYNPGEKFIWDMKIDSTGALICAVGLNGGVYRVDPNGEGVQIFAAEDAHIVAVYLTRNNSILAGSGDRGVIYRIDNRKAKVLFDSPFEEVRGICEDKDGNIYFSATKGIASTITPKNPTTSNPNTKNKEENDTPDMIDKSALYRINTNGVVEKIWTSRSEYIYDIAYDAKNDGVLVGTGDSGRVYRIYKDASFAIVYESDSAQVYKIANFTDGFLLASNNTATLTQISSTPGSSGAYYSDVYDLEIQSQLGRLYWEAQSTPPANLQLFVRTGNSNVPDNTWTQWSAPFTDNENSPINSADCRYFQLKASFNSGNTGQTPYLESLKVFYIQANLPPRIKKITFTKLPENQPKTSDDSAKTTTPTVANPGLRLLASWETEDLNKDTLKYSIYIKKYGTTSWIPIKKDITATSWELNPQHYQDGKYQLRVVADDALSNPPALAQTHTLESSPFLLDSTAPVVSAFTAANKRISFTVTDSTSIIARVLYSLDGNLWYPVFPTDMLNDSKTETFDFTLNGSGIILLKVADEFGNAKVFQEEI